MPIAVVGANPDECDVGVKGEHEALRLVGRPVMGHLDDRHRAWWCCGEHPLLLFLTEVGEEHDRRVGLDAHRDARGVAGFGCACRRPEDPPRRCAQHASLPGGHLMNRGAGRDQRIHDLRLASLIDRPDQHGVTAPDHGGNAANVIVVKVREHKQVNSVDRQRVQARGEEGRVWSGVNQRHGAD